MSFAYKNVALKYAILSSFFELVLFGFTHHLLTLQATVTNGEKLHVLPCKSEMAILLKQRMQNQQFRFPLLTWEKPYRSDVCSELNVEKYQLRKDGNIGYSHPNGTHDDVFWSIALAVYATTEMAPEPFLTVIPRS